MVTPRDTFDNAYSNLEDAIRGFSRDKLKYENAIDSLMQELDSAQEVVDETNVRYEALYAENERLIKEHKEDEEKRAGLESMVLGISTRQNLLQSAITAFEEHVKNKSTDHANQAAFFREIKLKHIQMVQWIKDLRKVIDEQKKIGGQKEEFIQELQDEIAKLKDEHERNAQMLKSNLVKKEREYSIIRENFNSLEAKFVDTEAEVYQLKEAVKNAEENMEQEKHKFAQENELKAEIIKKQEADLENLRTSLTASTENNEHLEKANVEINKCLEELRLTSETKQKKIEELETSLHDNREEIKNKEIRIKDLQMSVEGYEVKIEKLQTENEELQKNLESVSNQKQVLVHDFGRLKHKMERTLKGLGGIAGDNAKNSNSNNSLRKDNVKSNENNPMFKSPMTPKSIMKPQSKSPHTRKVHFENVPTSTPTTPMRIEASKRKEVIEIDSESSDSDEQTRKRRRTLLSSLYDKTKEAGKNSLDKGDHGDLQEMTKKKLSFIKDELSKSPATPAKPGTYSRPSPRKLY